jgi:glucose/arabinose dehydrogenase
MKLMLCVLFGMATAGPAMACDKDNAGLSLPAGFCASVFADDLGHARQPAVAPNGDVYVNTWSSRATDYGNAPGGYVVALRDENGDGRADVIRRFGPPHVDGSAGGGTGIAVFGDALYVEDAGKIVRYPLDAGASAAPGGGSLVPQDAPDIILSGLPVEDGHLAHAFAIAPDGNLFVNSGSGIWRSSARTTGQAFSSAERFATGTPGAPALAMQPGGLLYATLQSGDPLGAEVFASVQAVDDFGWPYCYYDAARHSYLPAPAYGGEGGMEQSECIAVKNRRVAFPPHWAPSGMTFYSGAAFPGKYRGGAFVAFHAASSSRPDSGSSLLAVVPFEENRALAPEVFATGFAGYRVSGAAAGPDGALYVSDDLRGRIWKITYEGVSK